MIKPTEMRTKEDVDKGLKRLAEIKIAMSDEENKLNDAIDTLKAKSEERVSPLRSEKLVLEALIESYVAENKAEFLKKRTMKFTFGKLSFKVAQSVKVISETLLIESLKRLGMDAYIRVKETPDKIKLAKLSAKELAKLGNVELVVKDKLTIAVDETKLREEAA